MKKTAEAARLSIPLWLVWVVALGFVLGGIGGYGLLNDNEGLYAEIPREMLASQDWRLWVIPYLNGLPYMEKPPLLYWLTAISFALFGEVEWAARIVPALSSLACVGLLLHFGRTVSDRQVGRLAAIIFVSGLGVIVMSHVLMFDMLLTAFLCAALMYAYRFMTEGQVRLIRLSYAFLGFALLAKGFVSLILFDLVILAFLLASSKSVGEGARAFGRLFEPLALLIFFAIVIPWHAVATMTEPTFGWFYFINEHVLRYLGLREPYDYYRGPWWYYLPRLAIFLFPWSFFVVSLFSRPQSEAKLDTPNLRRFLLIAWLVPLLFFSSSVAKANYYLIVAMPFAAFHLALALGKRHFLAPMARVLPGLLIGALAVILCVALVLRDVEPQKSLLIMGMEQHRFLIAAVAGIGLLAFAAAAGAYCFPRIGLLAYLALPAGISAVILVVLQAIEPTVSARMVATYLEREQPQRAVYLYRNFEEQSTLPFYLKKQVPIVDSRSRDLFWGYKLHPNHMFIPNEQFSSIMHQQPLAIVVMDRQLEDFKATGFFHLFKGEKHIGNTTVFLN